MNKTVVKILVGAFSLSLFFPLLTLAVSYNSLEANNYLLAKNTSPWTNLGLIALGGQGINLNSLKTFSSTTAIDYAAPIMAISASGNDPRSFGSEDLVARLKTFLFQNQIGDVATVNDDIFSLLAFVSAGEPLNDSVLLSVKDFIILNQNPNGGWGFSISGGTDSNMTAAAILALKAAGVPRTDSKIIKALDYLKSAQNSDGGFTYDPNGQFGTASDSSSTAWVLWALNALGIDQASWSNSGRTPADFLASTQSAVGYFEWQTGAGENSFSPVNTAYAVIALEGKTLPLNPLALQKNEFTFRIEGLKDTICEGKTKGPSALDVVKNASIICGFTFGIKNTSFGPYLEKVNGDQASGTSGWLYWVNNQSPSIGANDYLLSLNDTVLWAFGEFNLRPTKIILPTNELGSGQTVEALIEFYDGTSWKPLDNANVIAGPLNFTSDVSGKTQISAPDGFYKIFAEKTGFVRSPKNLLKIGTPSSSAVNLSVNVQEGGVQGTSTTPSTLSFTVGPANLDFGSLKQGQTGKKPISIKNIGSTNLQLESQVTAGQIFKDNLTLDGKGWKIYKAKVNSGENRAVEAGLTIPNSTPAGQQAGTLIFWASPK